MKIWILDKEKNKESNGIKKLLAEGLSQGLDIEFVSIEDIELVINANLDEKLFIKNQKVKLPDIVIPRMDNSYQIKSIIDFMENQGINIINSNSARLLANDKFLSLQKLAANRIPVPKTMLLKGIPSIDFIEKQLSYPIIIKKLDGHAGKGIIKVNNNGELEDILEMLEESLTKLNNNLIVQEYIGEKAGQDLRIFLIGGRVIGAMLRKGKEGDFKANFSGGGSVHPHELNETEEILAIESAKSIGLDIAGVDLLFDKDSGYKICEVNASPGWKGLEQATGINIAGEIISYIIKRYNINTDK
ncbi:MAG: RimK family alpha-L-glutamate ligase [Candidatus Gracilibacteria bacterium]|nr:RimK family alpha-L-glutamate ligase [Candidatus Gracilibacteria bacterium]